MRTTVDRKRLADALRTAMAVATNGSDLTALRGVRLEAHQNSNVLTVECSNGDSTIDVHLDADVAEGGVSIPPHSLFSQLVSASEGETFHLHDEGKVVTVACGGTQAELHTYDAEAWPQVGAVLGEPVKLSPDDMAALGRVLWATTQTGKDARLGCVHIAGQVAEATNSSAFARATLSGPLDANINVPAPIVAAVVRAAPGGATLVSDGVRASFTAGAVTWTTTLVVADFYDPSPLFGGERPQRLTFDRDAMAGALRRVKLFTVGGTDKAPVVTIDRHDDKLLLSSTLLDVGTIDDEVACGGDFTDPICFGVGLLADALEAHGPGQVTMELASSMKPVVLHADGLGLVLGPAKIPAALRSVAA